MSDHNDDVRRGYPVGDRLPGRNGSSPDERSELPLDFAAVQADDELIDALGRTGAVVGPETQGSDAQLTQVLLAWRRDVRGGDDGDGDAPLVDVDTALAVVAHAQRPVSRPRSLLVPFAAAAAMVVIAFSGLGLGAKAAEPGDSLWPLTKVLYAERARSVEAEVAVRDNLVEAARALQEDRPVEAQGALQQAGQELPAVADEDDRTALSKELSNRRDELRFKLNDPAPPPPAASASPVPSEPPPADVSSSPLPSPSPDPDSSATVEPPPPSPVNPEPSTPPQPGAGEVAPPVPRSDAAPAGDAPAPPETSQPG